MRRMGGPSREIASPGLIAAFYLVRALLAHVLSKRFAIRTTQAAGKAPNRGNRLESLVSRRSEKENEALGDRVAT